MICRDSNTIAQQEACQPPWHAICSPPPPPPPPGGGGGGGGPHAPPPPPPLGGEGGWGLARPVPTYPPTFSIRRQRIGSRRLRHRRRQALRHRRRWDHRPRCRCPRFRCTHRRTPRARRWRNWRLRSADQSLNSYVQSRLETFQTQEKNAEKRKKNYAKKSLTQPTAHEYNGVSRRDTPTPPSPPRGGWAKGFPSL